MLAQLLLYITLDNVEGGESKRGKAREGGGEGAARGREGTRGGWVGYNVRYVDKQ